MSEQPSRSEPALARVPRLAGTPPDRRRAIVVGASAGMGAAIVRQLLAEGWRVAALARRAEKLEELRVGSAESAQASGGALLLHEHDVVESGGVSELFETVVRELGGLDLLVYAAGAMPKVDPDQYDTEIDRTVVETNLTGCVAWCNPAASLFASQEHGTIVGISSISGDRGRKGNPLYCATKAAMNTYLESLRNRLAEARVHVCTIRPGYVDTDMTRGLEGLFWLITAEEAARQILAAARNRVNVRYVPGRWMWVGLVLRLIPSFVFRRLSF